MCDSRVWLLVGTLSASVAVAACGDDEGSVGHGGDGGTDAGDAMNDGSVDGGPPGGVGDRCTVSEDCRDDLVCDERRCAPSGTASEGESCTLTGDCAEGLYCGPRRRCAPAGERGDGETCTSTAECQKGLVCVVDGFYAHCHAAGGGDLGDTCAGARDCLAGLACLSTEDGRACASPPATDVDAAPPYRPSWDGVKCDSNVGEPVAYFDVPREDGTGDFYRLPFPNDIRRTPDGLDLRGFPSPGTAAAVDVVGRYVEASEQDLRGFATNAVVFFRFSRPHVFGSVGDNVQLVNVDPDSGDFGRSHPRFAWLNAAGPVGKYICPDWLALRPAHGVPLRPGTTYAAILRTGIVPREGDAYQRSEDFEAMLASEPPSGDDALAAAWDDYAPLRDWIADADSDVDPATVLNAAVFTTQRPEPMTEALRSVIRAGEAPTVSELTVCDGEATSPCDDGTEARRCGDGTGPFVEIHGRMELPVFQQGSPPYETPADGGGIETAPDGTPEVARSENVCFAVTLPRDEPMPAEGYPLLLYAHGTGGSFRGAVTSGLAADVATAEVGGDPVAAATLGIDLPMHGTRRGDSERDPARLFFNFANPRAARDNVMQGAADLVSMVYFGEQFARDAGGSPTGDAIAFDGSAIALFAHSQGATHASLMAPYEPGVRAVVLSGNGGDLTQSLLHKTEPFDIAGILSYALLDPARDGGLPGGSFHPALALFQSFFERADPVNYARRLHRRPVVGDPGRHVFMTYGLGDRYSPEPTMRAYARAARLTLVEPVLTETADGSPNPLGLPTAAPPLSGNRAVGGADWTIGMRQYMPDDGEDGHFVALRTEGGRADVLRYLNRALAGETPPVGM